MGNLIRSVVQRIFRPVGTSACEGLRSPEDRSQVHVDDLAMDPADRLTCDDPHDFNFDWPTGA
jgi:hypothetical protein